MPGDLASLLAALRSPEVRDLLRDLMSDASEEGARRALAQHTEALEPLASILGCSPSAARMRVNRDPELASLGMRVGRRLLFRRSEVSALMAAKARKHGNATSLHLMRRR